MIYDDCLYLDNYGGETEAQNTKLMNFDLPLIPIPGAHGGILLIPACGALAAYTDI